MAVAVGFQKAGIDEVLTVIQDLRVCIRELLCFLSAADVGKHTILDERSFGSGPFLIHGDKVSEYNGLLHLL